MLDKNALFSKFRCGLQVSSYFTADWLKVFSNRRTIAVGDEFSSSKSRFSYSFDLKFSEKALICCILCGTLEFCQE